jgi:hypothetical protein
MSLESTSVRSVWSRRKQIGTFTAVKQIAGVLNEQGIRAAGQRSLPLYWFVGYVALAFLSSFTQALSPFGGTVGSVLIILWVILSGSILLVAWPLSGLVCYWDCRAMTRYAGLSSRLGKVLAVISVPFGPGGIVLYLLYRAAKLS